MRDLTDACPRCSWRSTPKALGADLAREETTTIACYRCLICGTSWWTSWDVPPRTQRTAGATA